MFISVIIPTYNPLLTRLGQTLESLKKQTLGYPFWELIIIDNNSAFGIADKINLSWHPNSKVIIESQQGLTYARIKGFAESRGDIVVMIDDDNIPNIGYLSEIRKIFESNTSLGAIGGKSIPLFETPPPVWITEFMNSLALRDMGDKIIVDKWESKYPDAAPIGAGMAIRKKALLSYIKKITNDKGIITDRTAGSLSSGGDNDIVIEILKSGWLTGYFPSLILQHIIPRERLQANYLARLINNTNKSWIQLLESHNINPWTNIPAWTVPLRKVKAWFIYRAWLNQINYIKWRGACGFFDGLAEINEK